MKDIIKILELHKERILSENYPDTLASQILVNECNFGYEEARQGWIEWTKSNGLLANLSNF